MCCSFMYVGRAFFNFIFYLLEMSYNTEISWQIQKLTGKQNNNPGFTQVPYIVIPLLAFMINVLGRVMT